jgi:hypothetical protein
MMKAVFAMLFLSVGVALAADDASLSGKWTLHYNISGYSGDLDCSFNQNAQEITGTCKSPDGNVSVTGKVDGKDVTLTYKTEYNGDQLTVVYTGKLESPKKFAGSVTVQPMGADGEFTATQSN